MHKYPIKYEDALKKEEILALPEQLTELDRKSDS